MAGQAGQHYDVPQLTNLAALAAISQLVLQLLELHSSLVP